MNTFGKEQKTNNVGVAERAKRKTSASKWDCKKECWTKLMASRSTPEPGNSLTH